MLESRGAQDVRLPHLYHIIRATPALAAETQRRDVFVYDANRVLGHWRARDGRDPFPDLSADDIVRLRDPNALLILDCSGECRDLGPVAYANLAAWCERNALSLHRMVYVDQGPYQKKAQFDRWAEANNCTERMRFGFAHFWLDWTLEGAAKVPSAFVRDGIVARKTKRFLSMNNAPRAHRVLTVAHIQAVAGEESLTTLSTAKHSSHPRDAPANREFLNSESHARWLRHHRASPAFMARYGVLVDEYDPEATSARCPVPPPPGPLILQFDEHLYVPSLLSVVGETEMTPGTVVRVTEKAVKPALFGHPFIIAGNFRSLDVCRRLGLETFPELFDERYDTVRDPVLRLKAVLDEIGRLAAEPFDALADRVAAVRPKLVANHAFTHRAMRPAYRAWVGRQLADLFAGGPGVGFLRDVGPLRTATAAAAG